MSSRAGAGRAAVAIGITASAAGLAIGGVAAYVTGSFHGNPYASTQFATGVTAITVGAFVALRRPDHRLGWVLLGGGWFALLTFAGSSMIDWMIVHTPERAGLAETVLHLCVWGWIVSRGCFFVLAPLSFPDHGRSPLARVLWWSALAAIGTTALAHGRLWTFAYFEGRPPVGTARLADSVLPWGHRAIYGLAIVAFVGMFVRVARFRGPDLQTYLPFAGMVGLLSIQSLNSLAGDAFGRTFWSGADWLESWTLVALPVVLAAGVVRRGALGIDVVVRRATVYAVVAALGFVTYVGVVSLFSVFVQRGAGAGPVVATGLIAVGVLPAYAWSEQFVGRWLFGNRATPYDVVTALGSRLEQAPAGDEALQLVADTLAEQLRLPYVAVEVMAADTVVEAARHGTPIAAVERFPLAFQGETLGALVVARRTERDAFRPAEVSLLTAFARQAGVVAHNAALAQALVRSRAVLVAAREEERRRIRRDLHDGLGPTLATVSMSLGAAADRLEDDGALASLLRDLESEVQDAIVNIRRLVYDLRPPALDELGLVRALRDQADHLAAGAVTIDVDVPPSLEPDGLPSAVELAAYRVAVEAMTNVVRHARARRCVVAVEQNHQLVLRVEDDGIGIAPDAPRGIGLRSMRERVIELGGSLRIEPVLEGSGTRVLALFPLQDMGPVTS
jgi:signal transduction histidine kinase